MINEPSCQLFKSPLNAIVKTIRKAIPKLIENYKTELKFSSKEDAEMSTAFFDDLIVLDHTRYLTGGYPTLLMADPCSGCEVIKIEELTKGDFCRHEFPFKNNMGSHFVAIGRNKKSLTLDLKSEEGKEISSSCSSS